MWHSLYLHGGVNAWYSFMPLTRIKVFSLVVSFYSSPYQLMVETTIPRWMVWYSKTGWRTNYFLRCLSRHWSLWTMHHTTKSKMKTPRLQPWLINIPKYRNGLMNEIFHLQSLDPIHTRKPLSILLKPTSHRNNLLRSNWIERLYLPPYHCQFNPIEPVWGIVKNDVAFNNT